jgi:4-amino-4-deoxy-L-arabinose transferase-like glycosyltransferase
LTFIAFVLVVGAAATLRAGYLVYFVGGGSAAAPLLVQGEFLPLPEDAKDRSRPHPTELDRLVANILDQHKFESRPPLTDQNEMTAHRAPGYAWLYAAVAFVQATDTEWAMRWVQCVLGSLTAGCFFFFARRAFYSTFIGTLAGLLVAVHPFWIINTAELNDGVLTCFLFSAALMLGTRGGQNGGPFTGLVFGIALAGLCLVRAELLPFAILSLLWFLWQGKRYALGWVAGLMALIGFVNSLAPWMMRNYERYGRPVPIVTTTYYHLWMGNNPRTTGGSLDEQTMKSTLPAEQLDRIHAETNQAKRYEMLAPDLLNEVQSRPTETITRRFLSALAYFLGEHWLKQKEFSIRRPAGDDVGVIPEELANREESVLGGALLVLFALGCLGWRWSYSWRVNSRLATIAAVWLPLPYLLGHAEALSGPRLPLDGVLICYSAYVLASCIPGVVRTPKSVKAAVPEKPTE